MDEVKTPTCDRWAEISDERDAITMFLEFLNEKGIQLCTHDNRWLCACGHEGREHKRVMSLISPENEPCKVCKCNDYIQMQAPGFHPIFKKAEDLIYDMFEIDPKELEKERRALLDALRT